MLRMRCRRPAHALCRRLPVSLGSSAAGKRSDRWLVEPRWFLRCAHAAADAVVLAPWRGLADILENRSAIRSGPCSCCMPRAAPWPPQRAHGQARPTVLTVEANGRRARSWWRRARSVVAHGRTAPRPLTRLDGHGCRSDDRRNRYGQLNGSAVRGVLIRAI